MYDRRMRHVLGLALSAGTLALWLCDARPAVAKPEYTRRTTKDCSFCHAPGSYNLNEAGKYYFEHKHSLKGYEPPKPKASH
jgi:hypothetical protein